MAAILIFKKIHTGRPPGMPGKGVKEHPGLYLPEHRACSGRPKAKIGMAASMLKNVDNAGESYILHGLCGLPRKT